MPTVLRSGTFVAGLPPWQEDLVFGMGTAGPNDPVAYIDLSNMEAGDIVWVQMFKGLAVSDRPPQWERFFTGSQREEPVCVVQPVSSGQATSSALWEVRVHQLRGVGRSFDFTIEVA